MEVIYVDRLFLLDLSIDYCLLLLSGRVSGVVLRRGRYLIGATLGAAYAVILLLPGMQWLGSTVMKLILGLLMALIAYGCEARFWRCAGVFFAVSALFGGAVFAASILAEAEPLGGVFVSVTLRTLALSFGVCYFVVMQLFQRKAVKAARTVQTVEITYRGKSVALRALRDTGNSLHDPTVGREVLVTEREALLPLLPQNLPADPASALLQLTDAKGWKLLSCRTVGADSALLLCFLPDTVTVDGKPEDLLIGIANHRLSDDGSYQGLLPVEL